MLFLTSEPRIVTKSYNFTPTPIFFNWKILKISRIRRLVQSTNKFALNFNSALIKLDTKLLLSHTNIQSFIETKSLKLSLLNKSSFYNSYLGH